MNVLMPAMTLDLLQADLLLHILCFAIKGSRRSADAVLCVNQALAALPSKARGKFWFELCKARDWVRADRLWTLRVTEVDFDAFWHHQFKEWRSRAFDIEMKVFLELMWSFEHQMIDWYGPRFKTEWALRARVVTPFLEMGPTSCWDLADLLEE